MAVPCLSARHQPSEAPRDDLEEGCWCRGADRRPGVTGRATGGGPAPGFAIGGVVRWLGVIGWVLACFLTGVLSPGPQAASAADEPALVLGEFSGGAHRAVVAVLREDLEWAGLLAPGGGAAAVDDNGQADGLEGDAVGLAPWRIEGTVSGPNVEGRLVQPDGRMVWRRRFEGPDLRRNVHRLADDVAETLTGRRGIASTRIVFVREHNQRRELFTCDYDGHNEMQLTQDQSLNVGPSISADGRILVYTGYLGGFPDLYVIDLEAEDRVRLVDAPGLTSGAAVSPDGRLVALAMSFTGNIEIHVASLAGGATSRVTAGTAFSPSWSPDGRRLAVVYGGEGGLARPSIALCSLESGAVELLGSRYAACVDPAWSPDGRKLAYSVIDEGGRRGVVVRDLARGTERMVAEGGVEPAWSGSSRHLVFVRDGELHQIDVVSGRQRVIVRGRGRVSEPAWSWQALDLEHGEMAEQEVDLP